MNIWILKDEEIEQYGDEIYEMLVEGDKEFVPPLSSRTSTTQSGFTVKKESSADGIRSYFNEMKKQKIMVAVDNDKLLAFVSFRENHTCPEIDSSQSPNIYLSTLIVKPEGRGKRPTQTMYEKLFAENADKNIFTRTWSTNAAHIRILSKFSFETYKVLKNDRGEGIDTVYFVKKPEIRKG